MTIADQFDYFIFKGGEDAPFEECIDDSVNSSEEAEEYLEENSYESMEGFKVSNQDYFKSFMFYNDETDYSDIDSYHSINFVMHEHAELYVDCWDAGGHLQWVKTEEWKDGALINTLIHSDEEGNYFNNFPSAAAKS